MSMVRRSVPLQEMINESIQVVTSPSVATFERYEKNGTTTNAAIYVAIGAVISGILGFFSGGLGGLIGGVISALLVFFLFTGLVFSIGKQQGGTGTWDEVAYTFSLFIVPLTIANAVLTLIFGILGIVPILGILTNFVGFVISILLLVVQVYFGYLAVQSSMNLREQGKAMMTLGLAWLGTVGALLLLSVLVGIVS